MSVNYCDKASQGNQHRAAHRDYGVGSPCGARLMVPIHADVQLNTMLIQHAFVVHRLPKGSAFSGTGHYSAKGILCSIDGLLHIFFRMSCAKECRFVLRRWQVNARFEH